MLIWHSKGKQISQRSIMELLFKLWKQYAQVGLSRSTKPWHLLCDFYAKLIGMIIVH